MSMDIHSKELEVKKADNAALGLGKAAANSSTVSNNIPIGDAGYYKPTNKQHDAETIKSVQQNISIMLTSSKNMKAGTKKVMENYYIKHDPDFAKLNDKEKQAYINKKLEEFAPVLLPEGKNSEGKQDAIMMKIASLYTMAEVNKKPIEEIKNLGTDKINEMLKQMEQQQLKALISKVDTKNPLKTIQDFLKTTLMVDENYAKLSEKEKDKKLEQATNNFVKENFGFDMTGLPESTKNKIAMGTIKVLEVLVAQGKGVSDFMQMSPLEQNKTIIQALKDDPQLMQDSNIKELVTQLDTRAKLMQNAIDNGKDRNKLTERDLYEELKKIGIYNMSDEQKILYKQYQRIEQLPPEIRDRLLNDRADIKSATAQRALFNLSNEEYIKANLDPKFQNKETLLNNKEARKAFAKVLMSEDNPNAIKAHKAYLKKLGFTDNEIKNFEANLRTENPDLATRQANFKMRANQSPEVQAAWDNVAASSADKNTIDLFRPLIEITALQYNQKETVRYYEAQQDTTFYTNISTAVNQKPKEFGLEVEQQLAASNNLSDEKKTVATRELISTAEPDRQIYYAQEFSKIKNKAVTEGLIQAEPYVKPEAKEAYSKAVDYAINNNGYDSKTKTELNQKREEIRNNPPVADQSQTTKTTQNTSKTTTAQVQQKTATTQVQAQPQTQVQTSSTTSTAAEKTIQNQTLQNSPKTEKKDYGSEIAKLYEKAAMESKKTVSLERLQNIIENFQKAAIEAEEKQAAKIQKAQEEELKAQEEKVVESTIEEVTEDNSIKQKIRSAYHQSESLGDFYNKLGSIDKTIQSKFLALFAQYADVATLHGFAKNVSTDVIGMLYEYSNDPVLLTYLDESKALTLLSKGKIKIKDFLKYASSSTVATYINELNTTGNNQALKEIYSLMDMSKQQTSTTAYQTPLGGDDFYSGLQRNMELASGTGTDIKLPMRGNYDKRKVRGPIYFSA